MSRSLRRRQQDHVDASMKMDGEEELSLDPTFCLSKERCEGGIKFGMSCYWLYRFAPDATRRVVRLALVASCLAPLILAYQPAASRSQTDARMALHPPSLFSVSRPSIDSVYCL